MSYSVLQLEADLEGILHGTTLNQITNLDGVINRAARQVLMDVDPQETKRILAITNGVFNSVYDYSVPVDLKGNKIIDIFPQVNRQPGDVFGQTYNQLFDRSKLLSNQESFTIQFNQGVKTIRINAPELTSPVIINTCDSLTSNGTWVVGGNASNLTVDNINYVSNGGSLSFDLANTGVPASTGYLETSDMEAVDLSAQLNQGTEFLYTSLPTGSAFSNINFKFGSSATDYYSINATINQSGVAFQNGWNLMSLPWANATTTGTPDASSITYVRVTWTYDGTLQTAVRLDQIFSSLATILQMEYYSSYLFRDAITGAFQETVTSNSNLVNLATESYNLLLYKVAELAVQQQQGVDATYYDGAYFTTLYGQNLARYKAMYKSEIQQPQQPYYYMPNPRANTNPKTRFGF